MIKSLTAFAAVVLTFFGGTVCSHATEKQSKAAKQIYGHPLLTANSAEFDQSYEQAKDLLSKKGFESQLTSPPLGAAVGDLKKALERIRTGSTVETSPGQHGVKYDVILQPGHYGRKTGAVGTAGKYISEQKLAAFLVREVAEELRRSGLNVLVVPADGYIKPESNNSNASGLHGKVFLSIHADGSEVPCRTGPSLAYKSSSSTLAMHAIGHGLARSLGYSYENFRKDGFTANSANYYMFRSVQAPLLTGLLEVGELTCEPAEERLILSASTIATNVARAIRFVVETN